MPHLEFEPAARPAKFNEHGAPLIGKLGRPLALEVRGGRKQVTRRPTPFFEGRLHAPVVTRGQPFLEARDGNGKVLGRVCRRRSSPFPHHREIIIRTYVRIVKHAN